MIAALETELEECVRDYKTSARHVLADALHAIARPGTFRSMIGELVASDVRLADMARRSLWHPNGFAKVVLLSHPSYKLRLHVWRNETNSPAMAQGNVHNHGWDFSTVLLAGSYRHQEFRPSADGEEFFAYKYRPDGNPGSYTLVPAGTQALCCVFDAYLPQGSGFTISSEVLHRVIPDSRQPTVSLVLEGPRQPSSDDVFASGEVKEITVTQADALSADFLRRQLTEILTIPALG